MLRLALSLKNWQIFLLFLAYYFIIIGTLMLTNTTLPEVVESILFGLIPLTIYPLLVGLSLKKYISNDVGTTNKGFKVFIGSAIIGSMVFLVTENLKGNGPITEYDWGTTQTILAITWGCLGLVAFFKFLQFPSRAINSIELGREAGLWEYIADSFQMWIWPFGIFWLQPRINKINDRKLRSHS